MQDAIDIEPVRGALAKLGLETQGQLGSEYRSRLVALLAKAEASSTGLLREHRLRSPDGADLIDVLITRLQGS